MSSGGRLKKIVKRYREAQEQIEHESCIEKPEDTEDVLVHGYFIYQCQDCGAIYRMWLEKGLEDHVQDQEDPESHKPVPFGIRCKCGGFNCLHILWGIGDSDNYSYLKKGESYFSNSPDCDCGKPVLRKSFLDKNEFMRALFVERLETEK